MQQSPSNTSTGPKFAFSNTSTPTERVKPTENNLPNRFMRSYVDSQLSTSPDSPNGSPRNYRLSTKSDPAEYPSRRDDIDAHFPILVQDKIAKIKAKTRSEAKRRSSANTEIPVLEELEENEKENHFLKRLPVVEDAEEFNSKTTHLSGLRGRERFFNKDLSRCKSTEGSYLALDSVQEDKNEEEQHLFRQRRKLSDITMEDMNEFNQNDKGLYDRRNKRKCSVTLTPQDSIQEEQERTNIPHLQTVFAKGASGSHHGSVHNSPGRTLKVDEIDLQESKKKAKQDDDEEEINPIIEENEEKNEQIIENKEFQQAMHKLDEEMEFMKKVEKGEMRVQNETVSKGLEGEYTSYGSGIIGEVIEEDRNENGQS